MVRESNGKLTEISDISSKQNDHSGLFFLSMSISIQLQKRQFWSFGFLFLCQYSLWGQYHQKVKSLCEWLFWKSSGAVNPTKLASKKCHDVMVELNLLFISKHSTWKREFNIYVTSQGFSTSQTSVSFSKSKAMPQFFE